MTSTMITAWQGMSFGILEGFKQWMLDEGYSMGSINVQVATVHRYCDLAFRAGHICKIQLFYPGGICIIILVSKLYQNRSQPVEKRDSRRMFLRHFYISFEYQSPQRSVEPPQFVMLFLTFRDGAVL